jgi:hypothetical protein
MLEKVKFEGDQENTLLAKNLFLWDKKKKENIWLICAGVDTEFDLKEVSKYLKVGSGNLRGADEDALYKLLGCKKGMVNLYGMINDVEKKVKVVIDKRLADAEWTSFHPMDNTGSTAIPKGSLTKLMELTGRDETSFEILDFSTISSGVAAPKTEKANKPKGKAGQTQGVKMTAEEKKKKKELE